MLFRPVPPGRFRMGSRGYSSDEEPQHWVEIPPPEGCAALPPFWLGETLVTQAQFRRWTESKHYRQWFKREGSELVEGGSPHRNHFEGLADHPADSVSWWEAMAYCEWLNREWLKPSSLSFLPKGWTVRATLPAEAHWEYACRAGTDTEYHSGDGEAALGEVGWFGEQWGEGSTHPVARRQPNSWGFYDMHGNVWEWCLDRYDEEAYRKRLDGAPAVVPDAALADRSTYRVVRGGSWFRRAGFCRSAYRDWWGPGNRRGYLGFRVCLLPGPVAQDRAGRGAPSSR